MNLHQLVSGAIGTINPHVDGVMHVSAGYTTNAAGKRSPAYNQVPVTVQLQPLSSDDLKQIDGLNIQGIKQAAYLNGNFTGVNRPADKGGDLLVVGGRTWLVVQPLELWPDWCKLVLTLQVDPP